MKKKIVVISLEFNKNKLMNIAVCFIRVSSTNEPDVDYLLSLLFKIQRTISSIYNNKIN